MTASGRHRPADPVLPTRLRGSPALPTRTGMLTTSAPGKAMVHIEVLPVMALVTGFSEYQVRVLRGMARVLDERGIPLLVVAHEPIASDRTPPLVLDLIRRREVRGVVALGDATGFPR